MPLQRIVPAASYLAGADVGVHNAQDRMYMKLILNLSIKGNIWPSGALLPNMCERYFEYYMMSIFQQSTVFFVAIIFHIIDTFLYFSLF